MCIQIEIEVVAFDTLFTCYRDDFFLLYVCSSISSTLNAMAMVIFQEFIKPCQPGMSEKKATLISKAIVFAFGAIFITFATIAKYLGKGVVAVSIFMLLIDCNRRVILLHLNTNFVWIGTCYIPFLINDNCSRTEMAVY